METKDEGATTTAPVDPTPAQPRPVFKFTTRNAIVALTRLGTLHLEARLAAQEGREDDRVAGERIRNELLADMVADIERMFDLGTETERILDSTPSDPAVALVQLTAARDRYRGAIRQASGATRAWADKERLSGRTREGCVEDLQRSPEDGGKGMTATAAKTAASAHPRYTQYKDELGALSAAKDDAVSELEVARADFAAAEVAARIFAVPKPWQFDNGDGRAAPEFYTLDTKPPAR